MNELKVDREYMDGVYKLRKIEDYSGSVHSALDSSKLITVNDFEDEIKILLDSENEAPIVAVTENGERLNAMSVYLRNMDKELTPCPFCGREDCKLTKAEAIKHGAILEDNAESLMRLETADMPNTYFFKGVPAYYSLSALYPDEDEENPHAYMRYVFDEDEGSGDGWETREIQNPLAWKTELDWQIENGITKRFVEKGV